MKISIVMSVYNGAEHLSMQLDSIVNQTRKADEIIVIDDNSSDNSYEIINTFKEQYKTIEWIIIKNEKNLGWRRNFFTGINMASGDIVFPCDQDDIWKINKLERMGNVMLSNSNISVLTSNYCAFYENRQSRIIGPNRNNGFIIKNKINSHFLDVPFPGCTFCLRSSFIKRISSQWEENYPHDAFYWRYSLIEENCYSLNEDLIYWRKHADSTFSVESKRNKNRQQKIKMFEYLICFLIKMEKYVIKNNIVGNKNVIKIIKKTIFFLELRRKLMQDRNVFLMIRLLFWTKYYSSFKSYLGDIYICFRR